MSKSKPKSNPKLSKNSKPLVNSQAHLLNKSSADGCFLNLNVCDPQLELIDPNPDVHNLFIKFDSLFFNSVLQARCTVRWSSKMTLCAGTCTFDGLLNVIALSKPLLKLRPRSDTVNTLLHEMVHAYLFLTLQIRQRDGKDGHGPNFQAHMTRINSVSKSNITIYHTFNDEVDSYRTHIWKCTGICQTWRPHFGICKRSMNRPPQKADNWFQRHQEKCGGTFIKISGPDNRLNSKESQKTSSSKKAAPVSPKNTQKITSFFDKKTANRSKENIENDENKENDQNFINFSGSGNNLGTWSRKTSRLLDNYPPLRSKVTKIDKKDFGKSDDIIEILDDVNSFQSQSTVQPREKVEYKVINDVVLLD